MEAVGPKDDGQPSKARRPAAALRYPGYDLPDSVVAAKAIQDKGGGLATRDQLAAFLGYKTTNSGAFLSRVGAARLFNLIEGTRDGLFTITHLAQRILMPVYPAQVSEALIEAFMNVPLYKALYEEHKGKELPPEFGLRNLLRTKYNVAGDATAAVVNNFMNSADAAGFFSTRGARTHLIIPQFGMRRDVPEHDEVAEDDEFSGNGGGSDDGGNGHGQQPPRPSSREQLQNEYIALLLSAFKEKLDKGEMDMELGARIEKLVGLSRSDG